MRAGPRGLFGGRISAKRAHLSYLVEPSAIEGFRFYVYDDDKSFLRARRVLFKLSAALCSLRRPK